MGDFNILPFGCNLTAVFFITPDGQFLPINCVKQRRGLALWLSRITNEEFLLPVRSGKVPSAAEEAVLAGHVEAYKTRGFTEAPHLPSADEVEILRVRLTSVERKMASQLNRSTESRPRCRLGTRRAYRGIRPRRLGLDWLSRPVCGGARSS